MVKDPTCEECGDPHPQTICCSKHRCLLCFTQHGQSGQCPSRDEWWRHYQKIGLVRTWVAGT